MQQLPSSNIHDRHPAFPLCHIIRCSALILSLFDNDKLPKIGDTGGGGISGQTFRDESRLTTSLPSSVPRPIGTFDMAGLRGGGTVLRVASVGVAKDEFANG